MHIKVETFPLQGQMRVKDLRNIFHSDLLMRLAGVWLEVMMTGADVGLPPTPS